MNSKIYTLSDKTDVSDLERHDFIQFGPKNGLDITNYGRFFVFEGQSYVIAGLDVHDPTHYWICQKMGSTDLYKFNNTLFTILHTQKGTLQDAFDRARNTFNNLPAGVSI